jgi:hypothetical protein
LILQPNEWSSGSAPGTRSWLSSNSTPPAVIDYGPEHHLIWVVAINATGEIWSASNPTVRMPSNWTMGRPSRRAEPNVTRVRPAAAL